ncbi:MAG: hypothetical protein JXA35_01555, partial [Deltaproteobacteria bacterium]|nr:hypothetical protein [Deltaproteobacteria bacterium]
ISLCLSFGCQQSADTGEAKQKAQETPVADVKAPAITVYNPLGTPPPVILKDMAPRLDTINGKTIYIVNDGYPGSGILLGELTAVLKEKYPETTWVFKEKPGGMGSEDPALWKEMEERADAMIIALGH